MATELSILAAAIDCNNGPLPPCIARLIEHAPNSFADLRAGEVAAAVRAMRADCEPVSPATVGDKCPQHLNFIIAELSKPLAPEAAEYYAPHIWQTYAGRRAADIGETLTHALTATPEKSKAIIDAAYCALRYITSEGDPLVERLAKRLYSPAIRPQEPVPRYWLGNVGICTPANLTTISAQAKAGKSAAKGAMIASTFADPAADCLGFQSHNSQGYAVINFDTEQAPYDHWHLMEQVRRRTQAEQVPACVQSYCLAGFTAAEIRSSINLILEQTARQFSGIHSVFIDGIADAACDVNDPAEAVQLVAELHALAIKYDCPILNIIHVNPGSDYKTRGHLGSQLERKSETNLRLEKDSDGITVIWADKNRRAPIPKTTGPCFAWSESDGMHASVESRKNSRNANQIQKLQIEADAVFKAAGEPAICHGDFVKFLETKVHHSKSTAKRHLTQMVELGVINRQRTGRYALTTI